MKTNSFLLGRGKGKLHSLKSSWEPPAHRSAWGLSCQHGREAREWAAGVYDGYFRVSLSSTHALHKAYDTWYLILCLLTGRGVSFLPRRLGRDPDARLQLPFYHKAAAYQLTDFHLKATCTVIDLKQLVSPLRTNCGAQAQPVALPKGINRLPAGTARACHTIVYLKTAFLLLSLN